MYRLIFIARDKEKITKKPNEDKKEIKNPLLSVVENTTDEVLETNSTKGRY